MKYNGHKDKCQLRRQQLINKQSKQQINAKKSLNKRIIAERVGGITKENVDNEIECIGCMVEIDEVMAQIMYHIKFGRDSRPYTFNDDVIVGVFDAIKDLQVKFTKGIITAQEHLKHLEEIDEMIMEAIHNWEDIHNSNQ